MTISIPIIAIDGTAGSGKGTLAKRLASYFQYGHLDTGKLYRAVAVLVLERNIDPENATAVVGVVEDITTDILSLDALGGNHVGNMASIVSRIQVVRDALFSYQKTFPEKCISDGYKGAVVDGRDIGSVIFPDTPTKFYITADLHTRAIRRHAQLGDSVDFDVVLSDLETRDNRDMNAPVGRLVKTHDSIEIDTTQLDVDAMVAVAISHIQ